MTAWKRLRGVGWLVLKDMQILRRSPMMLALLVIYPILIALLIGFALSRGPDKPKVAVYIEISKNSSEFVLGGKKINTLHFTDELSNAVDATFVGSRKKVIQMVRAGDALGGIVVPSDLPQKLQTQLEQPEIEIYVNQEDPLKGRLVDNTINAQIARANFALSKTFARVGISYSDLLINGGEVNFLGKDFKVLGVTPSEKILRGVKKTVPARSKTRHKLQEVIDFAHFAGKNFDLADNALAVIGEPIKADKHVVSGKTPSLTSFAAALSVGISLLFVTVILGAAGLALEREEGAFTRLVQSPVSYNGLIAAKVALAVACSLILSVLLLLVLELFVSLDWWRFGFWIAALAPAASANAALGVAVGGLTREVRTASLAAIMLSLPVMFLALVPSGAVTGMTYDVIRGVSAVFPFKSTLNALNQAFYGAGPPLLWSLLHLAGLTLIYGTVGRLSLRRFSR